MTSKSIEKEKQGYYIKSHSWFNNKEIQLAVHECISYSKYKLLTYKLATALRDYLESQKFANTVQDILEKEST